MDTSRERQGVSESAEWQANEARRMYATFLQVREDIHRLADIIDRAMERVFSGDYTPVLPKLLARERPLHEIRRELGLEDR